MVVSCRSSLSIIFARETTFICERDEKAYFVFVASDRTVLFSPKQYPQGARLGLDKLNTTTNEIV